ncbi:unnamed protein product [Allacma fusca]|uniref:Uncharacterized protein n=1 Tax=Allacma fusca TaxID=39272 RepID=A0A8J2M482_9HEXA|nr:unnamed protein product [Allacma fusca]
MSCHIFMGIYTFGLLVIIAKSDDLAVSNRLYNQLCNSFENSQYGRVLPGSSGSSSVCPVIEKEGASNEWTFNTCG